ncbi:hypothetical protein BT69DRAFT_1332441 [Atractiella rhizophila]|nr:hypothetical protein BT69DRAFT_1332441 [Atractiella rhizophila]
MTTHQITRPGPGVQVPLQGGVQVSFVRRPGHHSHTHRPHPLPAFPAQPPTASTSNSPSTSAGAAIGAEKSGTSTYRDLTYQSLPSGRVYVAHPHQHPHSRLGHIPGPRIIGGPAGLAVNPILRVQQPSGVKRKVGEMAAANGNGSAANGNGKKSKSKSKERERERDEGEEERPSKKIKIGARVCAFCTTKSLPCTYEGHPAQYASTLTDPSKPVSSTAGYLNPLSALQHPAFSVPLPPTPALVEALEAFEQHFHQTGLFTFFNTSTLLQDIQAGEIPREVIFSILALSARFAPTLAANYTSSFASAAAAAAANAGTSTPATAALQAGSHLASLASSIIDQTPNVVSVHRCQANLLLGLHDYLEGEEVRGFMRLGTGIRMTQVLRLSFEDDCPGEGSVPHPLGAGGGNGTGKAFMNSEMRRRTFWSAYLLDRLLCARDRPVTIREANTRFVRMPCEDEEYSNGALNGTPGDGPDGEGEGGQPPRLRKVEEWGSMCFLEERGKERDCDLYGFLLRIADFWSDVATYIGQGGHTMDRRGPWTRQSSFYVLSERLRGWWDSLPPEMRLNETNFVRYNGEKKGRLFAVMHLVYFCSLIYLHRDFLPFAPLPGYDPRDGPIDVALVDQDAPNGWWEDSLREVTSASTAVTDLFSLLERHNTALAHIFGGFTVLTAGSMHAYMLFCPLPFPEASPSPPQEHNVEIESEDLSEYLLRDMRFLEEMRRVFNIGKGWCNSLISYFELLANSSGVLNDKEKKKDAMSVFKLRQGIVKLLRSSREEDELTEEAGKKKVSRSDRGGSTTEGDLKEREVDGKGEEKEKRDLKALLAATSGARKQLEMQEREQAALRRSGSVQSSVPSAASMPATPTMQALKSDPPSTSSNPSSLPIDALIPSDPHSHIPVSSASYLTSIPTPSAVAGLYDNSQFWGPTAGIYDDPLLTLGGFGLADFNNSQWQSTFGMLGGYGMGMGMGGLGMGATGGMGGYDYNPFANVMGTGGWGTGTLDMLQLGLEEEQR